MTEDEMVGWHHRLIGHGFQWTPGVGDGQGGLACFSSWSRKESDTTEELNWTELNQKNSKYNKNLNDYIKIAKYEKITLELNFQMDIFKENLMLQFKWFPLSLLFISVRRHLYI